jgi:hypothetical protein
MKLCVIFHDNRLYRFVYTEIHLLIFYCYPSLWEISLLSATYTQIGEMIMFNQKRLTVLTISVLLSLLFAAVLPFAVFADDGAPPVDVPVVEEVVPPADVPVVDVPAVEEVVPPVDAPAVEEVVPPVDAQPAEDLTVPQVLDALPEGTDLVVVDSSGDALSLASQEAADTLDSSSADPFFWDGTQYVGYSASGVCAAQVTGSCTTTATPLADAIAAFGATNTATGSIYVAAGTYAANVIIDGNVGNLNNLTGLVGEGSGATTLNGNVQLQNMNIGTNVFTFQGFTLNGGFTAVSNTNTLNITDIVQQVSFLGGFTIQNHTGNVTLTDVDASGNRAGAGANFTDVTGNVTVTTTNGGTSTFNNNYAGLYVKNVSGSITINDVTITNNYLGGFYNAGGNGSPAILNCVTFSGNTFGNIVTPAAATNQTSVGCGSGGTGGGSAYVPFPKAPRGVTLAQASSNCDGEGREKGFKPQNNLFLQVVTDSIVAETTPLALDQQPGALPDGKTLASGVSVKLMQGCVEVKSAPGGVKVFIDIPAGAKAPFTVLMWNGTAWVEVASSVVGRQVVFTVSGPGSYALVTQ